MIRNFGKICGINLLGLVVSCAALAASAPKKPAPKTPATKKPVSASSSSASKSHVTNTSASTSSHRSTKHHKTPKIRGQAAPTNDRISEIQTALAKSGAYQGDPSGKWDESSVEAMKKFQQQNGLEPNGKLDALSLQKLGLGSGIAGRAAPRPITSSRAASSPSEYRY